MDEIDPKVYVGSFYILVECLLNKEEIHHEIDSGIIGR
jgi:hypothetical protein